MPFKSVVTTAVRRPQGLVVLRLALATGLCLSVLFWSLSTCRGQSIQAEGARDEFEQALRARIADNPDASSNFRMLGRWLETQGRTAEAWEAYQQAVQLEPTNAAALFDWGRALQQSGHSDPALQAWRAVIELAPESEYAAMAQQLGQGRSPSRQGNGPNAGASSAWRTTPGAATTTPVEVRDGSPWPSQSPSFHFTSGLLFNTNVALAPLSRQAQPGELAGAQLFLAPSLQTPLRNVGPWQLNATFSSYATVNEGHLQQFDLQHLRPAVSAERLVAWGDYLLVPRLQYDYAIDFFAWRLLARRHALTPMVSWFRPDGPLHTLHWTVDYTDFRAEGTDPLLQSLDGWTHTLGLNRTVLAPAGRLVLWSVGTELQWADLVGADEAYRAVYIMADAELALLLNTWLIAHAGAGYRSFPTFTGPGSRDDVHWRLALEARRQISDNWSLSTGAGYDRFDSVDPSFTADRMTLGLWLTYRRPARHP